MAEEQQNDDNVVRINLQELAETQNQTGDEVHKVDLSKPPGAQTEDASDENQEEDDTIQEVTDNAGDETNVDDSSDSDDDSDDVDDSGSNNSDDSSLSDDSALSEITDEEEDEGEGENSEAQDAAQDEEDEDTIVYPENIQKLVDFMNDTGGSIEDYVLLNKDVENLSADQLLLEYHKNIEPGLENDEYKFIMEDTYEYDEDEDDERTIKKKQIAKKRAVAKAKKHLEGLKSKYYDEIKAGSKLTPEQQKAVNFFNRYNEDQKGVEKTKAQRQKVFAEKTKSVFNDKFKGFEFKVGEKRYRYNVKDAKNVMSAQANIENFTKKYLGDDNTLNDAQGYHKALFTAMNADAIADHFYKQGMADAVKTSAKNKKNINMGPRQGHAKVIPNQAGLKARVVDNDAPSGKLRIKQ